MQFDAIDVEKALSALPVSVGSVEFKGDFAATVGPRAGLAGELAGRSGPARSQLLSKGGGNPASERCVTNGLNWLVRYQQPDGKWSFRHGPDDPGSLAQCTTGATGLALLSFLGAGHTHRNKNSRYRANVDKGLRYLVSQIKLEGNSGDLRGKVVSNEGMYADAIATLRSAKPTCKQETWNSRRTPSRPSISLSRLKISEGAGGGTRRTNRGTRRSPAGC